MAIRRYEIDLGKGILKANDPDDHQRMMEALSVLQAKTSEPLQKPAAVSPSTKSGLRLGEFGPDEGFDVGRIGSNEVLKPPTRR